MERIVIEKVTPATVIMEPATVDNTARAPAGWLADNQPMLSIHSEPIRSSTAVVAKDSAMAPIAISDGTNQ